MTSKRQIFVPSNKLFFNLDGIAFGKEFETFSRSSIKSLNNSKAISQLISIFFNMKAKDKIFLNLVFLEQKNSF